MMGSSFIVIIFMASLLLIEGQQLSQRTLRKNLLEAVRKCSEEYNPPDGIAVTFFTSPEITDQSSKCFSMCILNKFNLIDLKGNFKNEGMQPFLKSIPRSRFRSSLEQNLDSCLQEKSDDPCDKGYRFVQCFYKKAVSPSTTKKPGSP